LKLLLGPAFLALLVVSARAADIHVPGDAASIQAAIDQAHTGDTIIVGPGVWVGAVHFDEKPLTLVSEGGHAVTTIDCGPETTFTVIMDPSSGSAALDGFRIIGGSAGRVYISGNGQTIVRRCNLQGGGGVGVGVYAVGGDGPVTIDDCLVQGNRSGGVVLKNAAVAWKDVRHCLIKDNGSAGVPEGGGVWGVSSVGSLVRALDCLIVGNVAIKGAGAYALASTQGSVFLGNHAVDSGGAYSDLPSHPSIDVGVDGAAILGNSAPFCGGVYLPNYGPVASGQHNFTRCVFAGNTDDLGNYGLMSFPDDTQGNGYTNVTACTFIGDRAFGLHTLTVRDSIVRSGRDPLSAITIDVEYSDIEGGATGTGNFDADPLFVDAAQGVYALRPGSPCVDAGSPSSPPDPDGSTADVGALPLSAFASAGSPTFGQFGLPDLSGSGTLDAGTLISLRLQRARPLAPTLLVIGLTGSFAPLKGGVLVPTPQLVVSGLLVDSQGEIHLSGTTPNGLPSGLIAWVQFWIVDAAAATGLASSNGLGLVAP